MWKHLKVTNHDKLLDKLFLFISFTKFPFWFWDSWEVNIRTWPTCGLYPWFATASSIWHHGDLKAMHEKCLSSNDPQFHPRSLKGLSLAILWAWEHTNNKTDLGRSLHSFWYQPWGRSDTELNPTQKNGCAGSEWTPVPLPQPWLHGLPPLTGRVSPQEGQSRVLSYLN